MRVGIGFDVHRFAKGRPLILGGMRIPHDRGLAGHSDADVLLHAICDAMLGAAALGDIGVHFPDTDEKFRGIASTKLLKSVAEMVRGKGYEAENIDATVIAQEPKIAPYQEKMRVAIAGCLGCAADCVSVKATTTEGMGFCGRGEGIAAIAVAILKK